MRFAFPLTLSLLAFVAWRGLIPKRTIRQWEKLLDVRVLDPDGFNRRDPHLYQRRFSRQQFLDGLTRSTICMKRRSVSLGSTASIGSSRGG